MKLLEIAEHSVNAAYLIMWLTHLPTLGIFLGAYFTDKAATIAAMGGNQALAYWILAHAFFFMLNQLYTSLTSIARMSK